MEKYLHVISFNIPYPANYGGVIDVYYKLKALSEQGVRIILHCFEYGRSHAEELEDICYKVYYYPRKIGLLSNISCLPYNVNSRISSALKQRLLEDKYPILMEGLHSTYLLSDKAFDGRFFIFREANIEHDYYKAMAEAEPHLIRKLFFNIESWRFKRYESVIERADLSICVSTADTDYLRSMFPGKHVEFMPCFHANNEVTSLEGTSDFILYHGNLSVKENEKAALYLIDYVFRRLPYQCVIAGMNPSEKLIKTIETYPNITLEANPTEERMKQLIREAQIHLLITFQGTGLKLKLLNSLFAGRFTVVNQVMLSGSGLDDLCCITDVPSDMIMGIERLMQRSFTEEDIEARKKLLLPVFSNSYQAKRLIELIEWEGE